MMSVRLAIADRRRVPGAAVGNAPAVNEPIDDPLLHRVAARDVVGQLVCVIHDGSTHLGCAASNSAGRPARYACTRLNSACTTPRSSGTTSDRVSTLARYTRPRRRYSSTRDRY
jgi:hypothetical protein